MLRWKKVHSSWLVIIVFLFLGLTPLLSFCVNGSIDIFTQREPYNGKGLNAASDAFAPGQEVVVYAMVSYNQQPLSGFLVGFVVKGPPNDVSNITLQISAETNESGIAQIAFTIPNENSATTFGIWSVFGSIELEGQLLQDSLEFQVGWIVEILGVNTLDENLSYATTFGIGGYVGVEIILKSIAMSVKNVTFCLNVFDALKIPAGFVYINNFEVPPNEKIVHLYSKMYLPSTMLIGNATLLVSAFTPIEEGETPYCPDVAVNFSTVPFGQRYPKFHDVSTLIVLSKSSVEIGQKLVAELHVQNEGTETESFEVKLSLDSLLSESFTFQSLPPYSQKKVTIEWDTSGLDEKSYSLVADITPLENEVDLTDNTYRVNVELFKEQPPQPPPRFHDIAVTNVISSAAQVYESETVEIYVTVKNNGTETECFNVTLYYDSNVIDVLRVENLAAGEKLNLTFVWNTLGVAAGKYTLKAEADVVEEGEVNINNNVFVDGLVEVKAAPAGFVHDVAIVSVEVSPRTVAKGETVNIKVHIRNEGNFSESFNLTVFYDGFAIETRYISRLAAGQSTWLSFFWNTSNVSVGVYTISAEASRVIDEEDLGDNELVDGTVEVVEAKEYHPPWPLWLLLFTIGLLALLGLTALAIVLYRRRQLKKFKHAFYSGWHAWFYNYDLTRKKGND